MICFKVPFACRPKKNNRPVFFNKKTGRPFVGKDNSLVTFERDSIVVLNSQKWSNKGVSFPIGCKMHVKYVFCFKGKCRADLDNLLTSAQDLLQSADIVLNDKLITRVSAHLVEDCAEGDFFSIKIRKIK